MTKTSKNSILKSVLAGIMISIMFNLLMLYSVKFKISWVSLLSYLLLMALSIIPANSPKGNEFLYGWLGFYPSTVILLISMKLLFMSG